MTRCLDTRTFYIVPRVNPEGAEMAGRAGNTNFSAMGGDATDDRLKSEWIVRGESGTNIGVTVRHDRAGRVDLSLTLQ